MLMNWFNIFERESCVTAVHSSFEWNEKVLFMEYQITQWSVFDIFDMCLR